MFVYEIKISTGDDSLCAGTMDTISIVLVGSRRESTKQTLDHWGQDFLPGAVDAYQVTCKEDLGEILVVRLYKEQYMYFPESAWFCNYVNVKCPNGQEYQFPYYRWICGYVTEEIQQGKGIILTDSVHPVIKKQRKLELEEKRKIYKWTTFIEGMPHCIDVKSSADLPPNEKYSFKKSVGFGYNYITSKVAVKFEGLLDCKETWKDFNDIKKAIRVDGTTNSELVTQLWMEDSFFGYQYLNGTNPIVIQQCLKIPGNFPVDVTMVAASLGPSTNLNTEIKNGNIFLADYKVLDGLPTNIINDESQYLAAPLCLLWKSPKDELLPIAIQLNQTPGKDNPIFLPTDPEWDWTLAKIWVRNAEFQVHQVISHLLRVHFLAEVFNMATNRQLPMGHPLYKLIVPHIRYTLDINDLARRMLVGPGGTFDESIVTGREGGPMLFVRGMEGMTYNSLCLPDNLESRGVMSVPNYYYRDDGMKIWKAVESYVSNIVHYYYVTDEAVSKDAELQAWVAEIYKEGFLSNKSS
ncbi:hypothetical protein GDO86_018921, partial [Hymenochirus boettgeri]